MTALDLKALSFPDKLKLLTEEEKWYLCGYMDRALDFQRGKAESNASAHRPVSSLT